MDGGDTASAERLVYVTAGQAFSGEADERISLRQVWNILWRGKVVVIAVTAIFALGSIAYALLAQEVYRAEVLLMPETQQSSAVSKHNGAFGS